MTERKNINNEVEEARAMQKWFNERFDVDDSIAPFATDEIINTAVVDKEGIQIKSGETSEVVDQQG